MAKLKNSVFSLEQENALHVYRAQKLYVATKGWQQTYSRVNGQKENLTLSLTLTLKVNTLFIQWNAYYVIGWKIRDSI